MKTVIPDLTHAVKAIRQGKVIAYPTEAVFGLGCNPLCLPALQHIIRIKGRCSSKGLILIAERQEQLTEFIEPANAQWQEQFDQQWPGPVTFIVPVSSTLDSSVSQLLTGHRDTIAVRVTDHPVVRALCQQCDSALVSTSANRSGQQALRTAREVKEEFGTELSEVVNATVGDRTDPSRIVDVRLGTVLR